MAVSWLFSTIASFGLFLSLSVWYIKVNDRKLRAIPQRAEALSPKRWTPEFTKKEAARFAEAKGEPLRDQLPPKTGRRYIVVGGSGFVGGWIVRHLLERGEDPHRIRIIDLRPPVRSDVIAAISNGVQLITTDVSDPASVDSAFTAPWPKSTTSAKPSEERELTVFHTAANIRFFERSRASLYRSNNVNLLGTQNVVNAAKKAGATVLVYTSSASVGIRRTTFLLWPWQKEPEHFVQVINDDEDSPLLPKCHEDYFSNYAVSKNQAERFVRAADKSEYTFRGKTKTLRTGAIRPGNAVFGPNGDMLCGAYLVRQDNPSWLQPVIQSLTYVENCTLAHLLYERQLVRIHEQASTPKTSAPLRYPDIGGQAYLAVDPGPPPTYGDVYTVLTTLTAGKTTFPMLSPTGTLILAYIMEFYYTTRDYLLESFPSLFKNAPFLKALLPALGSEIVNLQPSLWALTTVHLVLDDSRARKSVEKGGLGYKGFWNTFEGVCRTVEDHISGVGVAGVRSGDAGVGFGYRKRSQANANGR